MPVTPFHFGPGAVLHALAPKQVSFLSFCAANVLMDVEPLYYMWTRNPPWHRFLHTLIGAALVALAIVALYLALRRLRLPNILDWRSLRTAQVAIGAAAGSYSHIVFDSIMHEDIRPLAPFSELNPLLDIIPLGTLHWSCLAAGAAALVILAARRISASHVR